MKELEVYKRIVDNPDKAYFNMIKQNIKSGMWVIFFWFPVWVIQEVIVLIYPEVSIRIAPIVWLGGVTISGHILMTMAFRNSRRALNLNNRKVIVKGQAKLFFYEIKQGILLEILLCTLVFGIHKALKYVFFTQITRLWAILGIIGGIRLGFQIIYRILFLALKNRF